MKHKQTSFGILQIESLAWTANISADDFLNELWSHLIRNKGTLRKCAKQLNCYPSLGNTYAAIVSDLFGPVPSDNLDSYNGNEII